MTPPPPRDRRGFEVALICALNVEADAVHAVFDKFWDDEGRRYGQAAGDDNSYVTGTIGEHNVVLTYLPGMGKVSATAVSTQLRSSFPSIKIALVVGICGGVPFDADKRTRIYLGDLIISTALVQYDFGRQYPNAREPKDTLEDRLGRPNFKVRAHLSKLQTSRCYRALQSDLQTYLDEIKQRMPNVRYPGGQRDQLYEATYVHQHRFSTNGYMCSVCDQTRGHICTTALELNCTDLRCEASRSTIRKNNVSAQQGYTPQIYFGRVGSGDTVVKSGSHRDNIAARDKVIAFEMEGAGVWDQLPCVVLKAVCDYADSHKNKVWQHWAAAVAAAGLKAFLKTWTPSDESLTYDHRDGGSGHHMDVGHGAGVQILSSGRPRQTNRQEPSSDNIYDTAILASLAFDQMFERRNNVEAPHGQTCQWILHTDAYQDWITRRSGLLWIKGKPGAGKSTIMSFLYATLRREHHIDQGLHLEFFYSARGNELQRTPIGMLRSLINQLYRQDSSIRDIVRKPYQEKDLAFGRGRNNWKWQKRELEALLIDVVVESAREKPLTIFIDALDEAGEQAAREMVHYFHNMNDRIMATSQNAKIVVSCRHYPIVSRVRGIEVCVEDNNREDIAAFVRDRLQLQSMSPTDPPHSSLWHTVADELVERANGVFQWIALVMPMVEKLLDDGESLADIQQQLRQVPDQLGDVYEHIVNQVIDFRYRRQSLLLFQWVCLAERPLTITEMRFALAASNAITLPLKIRCRNTKDFVTEDEHMKLKIYAWSGGLIEVVISDKGSIVQVTHQSVNEFFFSQGLVLLMANQTSAPVARPMTDAPLASLEAVRLGQKTLYQSCLHYLLREGDEAMKDRAMNPWRASEYFTRVKTVPSAPFLKYAAINLFTHAGKVINWREEDLNHDIGLLSQVMRYWVKACYAFDGASELGPDDGTTLLHAAAAVNLIDIVHRLVHGGVDVGQRDHRGYTALHLAARGGFLSLAQSLHEAGSLFSVTTKKGLTPLVIAAGNGHLELVQWFLDHDDSLRAQTGGAENALRAAASNGNLMVTQLLLGAGADVNYQEKLHGSALHAAAVGGHTEIVQTLLEHGASVNATRANSDNALHLALSQQNFSEQREKLVQLLLDYGIDIEAHGQEGTALQAASEMGGQSIVEMLLRRGADINVQGSKGTALYIASWYGHPNIVHLLIEWGANVNAVGGEYGTALQAASRWGWYNVIEDLLDNKADVDVHGKYGTALQIASRWSNEQVVPKLLVAGADVNAEEGVYGTALQAASHKGKEGIIRLLIDQGADVNARGTQGRSALQIARSFGHETIAKILLDHGAVS